MDTVKSNKAIIYTILLAIIVYGGIYLIQMFVNIPKTDSFVLNIMIYL